MDTNLRAALVADYEQRIAAYDSDGELDAVDLECRSKAQATLDALNAWQPTAPAAPKELRDKVELRKYVDAVMRDAPITGAEAELNAELGLDRGLIPLSLLDLPLEVRVDANTALPAGNFDANLRPVVTTAFAGSDLAFLGITPARVAPGTTKIPIISATGGVASPVAKSTNVDAAAATIASVDFNAKEIRKRFKYSFAETYEWGPRLENALRDILRRSLSERLDDMAIAGSGTAPQPSGIFASLTAPANPSGEADFDDYAAAGAAQIDGKYANAESGMAILCGLATFRHARSKRQAASGLDAIRELANLGVAVRASGRVASVASKRQDALLALSPQASRDSFFVAVWNAFRLIKDETTYSSAGDVALTATLYYDAKELIDGGIKRIRFQVAP